MREEFPNSVFFASRLVFENEHWWNRWLHSQTPLAIQRVLNTHGVEVVILPVTLHYGKPSEQVPGSALSH